MDVVPKTLKPSRKGKHIWRTTHLSISGWDETDEMPTYYDGGIPWNSSVKSANPSNIQ
jgi:hypothetical protein